MWFEIFAKECAQQADASNHTDAYDHRKRCVTTVINQSQQEERQEDQHQQIEKK
jgi:hypothetical protein